MEKITMHATKDNRGSLPRRAELAKVLAVGLLALGLSSCGGGGGGFFSGVANIAGKAFRPVSEVIDSNPLPLGKAPVTLIDFADDAVGRNLRTMVVGETDEEGNFNVSVQGQEIIAIVVAGTVDGQSYRSSGLVQAGKSSINKNFNAVTDIACEAMIGAINRGELAPNTVSQRQIDVLEEAAKSEVPNVDFTDPTSVSAAARRIAAATANGTVALSDAAAPLDCQTSETTCDDGSPICAELKCNGTVECADGSDENPDVCSVAASCCAATSGCPGETGSSCTDECCCCGIGEVCDQANFANGCVAGTGAKTLSDDSALSKLISTGVYY